MSARSCSHAQLDLFQSSTARSQPQVVGSAVVPPALWEIALRFPACVYLGTSSWTFPGWQGVLYDRNASQSHLARYGLAAYAQHPLLRAVGIDRTYYAPIAAADFAVYAAAVAEEFRFLVKAHAWCTHVYVPHQGRSERQSRERNAFFLDPAYATEHVVAPYVEGLGSKAGPLLFQFPPQNVQAIGGPQRFAERLHDFLKALPQGPLYAVEVRNVELLVSTYAEVLADVGACHCYKVHPRMPTVQEQLQIVPCTYAPAFVARWMLHPRLGYDAARVRYEPFDRMVDADPVSRATMAALCLEAAAANRPAFVIANNKAEGSAPLTLFRLAEQIIETQPTA